MKVVSYLKGIPNKNKNNEKEEVLKKFIEGVKKLGDDGVVWNEFTYNPADVAVIQGFVHGKSEKSPHLVLRKEIIQKQQIKNLRTLIIDSNLFLYADHGNSKHYLRYSFDGVFPTTGNYFWNNPDPQRWKKISKDLNISLKDWTTEGRHILICTQRNGGWSMGDLDVVDWLNKTIKVLKNYTDRDIIIRGHPGDKKAENYLSNKKWKISNNKNICDDFKNAHAVITYNSSPGVAAAIEGIPVFVTDPTPEKSQAKDVANLDISKIENPLTFDRQSWIEKISMCHWNFDEISNGTAWKHIRQYV